MTQQVELELKEAEMYFQALSGQDFNALASLERCVKECVETICAEISGSHSEKPKSLLQGYVAEGIAKIRARYPDSAKFFHYVLPFQEMLYSLLRGNLLLFLHRGFQSLDRGLVSFFENQQLPKVLHNLRTSVEEWHRISCEGRATNVLKGKHSRSRHKHEEKRHNKPIDISKIRESCAQALVDTVLLPYGADSLYLPLPSMVALMAGPFIQRFVEGYALALSEKIVEVVFSRESRARMLSLLTQSSLAISYEKGDLDEDALQLTERASDDCVDEVRSIASIFFPQDWNRYFRFLPLQGAIRNGYARFASFAQKKEVRDRLILRACCNAVERLSSSRIQDMPSVSEEMVIEALEEWSTQKKLVEKIVSMCIPFSSASSSNQESLQDEERMAQGFVSLLTKGLKLDLAKKASSAVIATLHWEDNAPIVVRKSCHYLLSDTFEAFLLQIPYTL